jgi:hypothetical protein
MAGCFGNSDWDRHLERELYNHLNSEAAWDNFCEKVSECFHPAIWDDGMESYFEGKKAQEILSEGFNNELPYEEVAENIFEHYQSQLKND